MSEALQTGGDSTGGGYGSITPMMIEHLRETKPWVRLMSILGFVGAGLTVLAALFMIVSGAFTGEFGGMAMVAGMALVYLFSAVIYFFVSLYLARFAGSITQLVATGEPSAMEQALGHQKTFWRLVGIVAIVYLLIVGAMIVFGLIFGALALLELSSADNLAKARSERDPGGVTRLATATRPRWHPRVIRGPDRLAHSSRATTASS